MKLSDINVSGYQTILLDRDGTINVHIKGDYVRRWEDFVFIDGALAAIQRFSQTAKHVFVVTNQRGVGRGLMTEEQLRAIHAAMIAQVNEAGGRIDQVYYSTDVHDDAPNRKPNTGMWKQILKDYPEIEPETTLMIGDSDSDMQFAKNCGIAFARVSE